MKRDSQGLVLILVYVDDLMLLTSSSKLMQQVKEILRRGYKLKDLGPISAYLGLQVTRDKKTRTIDMGLAKYIGELEHRFSSYLSNHTRVAHTPMTPELMKKIRDPDSWSLEESADVSRKEYMKLLGSLMFASITCRPDITFSVSFLSQWGTEPKQLHLDSLVRVLRYLVHTKKAVLTYQGSTSTAAAANLTDSAQPTGPHPVIYTDSDWGSEPQALSRAGWLAKLAGGAISWYSKKLTLVALSSTEAEYKALAEGGKEAIWLKQIMGELHLTTGALSIYL